MAMVKNQSAAEEITQNTFYRAMTSKKKFEGNSGVFTWLCSIAKRLAIDEFRKNKRYEELGDTILADAIGELRP